MSELIRNEQELRDWFCNTSNGWGVKKKLTAGIFVSSKIRKEVLTSNYQGKITLRGRVMMINFENHHGGVWRAYLSYYDVEKAFNES